MPVAALMALSFGTLVLLSIAGVLALTVGANIRNTLDLLGAQSTLLVDAMEDSLRAEMERAENAVNGVAQLYAQGEFQIDDDRAMTAVLAGALSGAGQATAILICTPDMVCRGVARTADGKIEPLAAEAEKAPQILAALEQRRQFNRLLWGSFVANEHGLFANVSMPLSRGGGAPQGWAIAAVELQKLSDITRDLSQRFGTHAFILDGNDRVIADERLTDLNARKNGLAPLMPLATFGDPVLAAYSTRKVEDQFDTRRTRNVELAEISVGDGADDWWDDDAYVAITRQISGYGEQPWTIGAYFKGSQIGGEIERIMGSAMLGLAAMAAAVVVAILLGKRLSKPIQAIAGHATRVADFDLDDVSPLPRSRIKELDDQASAFNAMLIGLRAFSTYIPRSLVAKLVRTGEIGIEPRETIVTVMFTDIADFTALSEQMDAAAVSQLLNRHFAILCAAVDAYGGTVDKFLGDGMMAFFGAPDRLKGHAAAAVRAAAQIREDLAADNLSALNDGHPALRIRIGIHTGPVIVGNIGASDRVNYTIIGDTVNVSQRLQGIGKELAPEAATTIAISAETASRLDERFEIEPAGRHRLRGRGEPIEVFLVGEVAAVEIQAVAERQGAA